MGINKKYLLSLGVAYYPEKEMVRLQKQASMGWHFVKMNRLGFLKFIKGKSETTKYAVDFFEGDPSEIVDYLAMYQAGGWTYISNYKDRYFYFKASPDTPAIFSDQESYQERIDNETRYLMKKIDSIFSGQFSNFSSDLFFHSLFQYSYKSLLVLWARIDYWASIYSDRGRIDHDFDEIFIQKSSKLLQ